MFPIHSRKIKSFGLGAGILALVFLVILLAAAWEVQAKPTDAIQARQAVEHWLALDGKPLGCPLGYQVREVQPFTDSAGQSLYFIVYLNPTGFVIVSGDDLVEPVIGFLSRGRYDPSPANPLGALVSRDVPGRVAQVRQLEETTRKEGLEVVPLERFQPAKRKWERLLEPPPAVLPGSDMGLPTVSDICVAPLVQSKWDQEKEGTKYCYNYYTPNHYPCGCIATAMAQLMRYWEWPIQAVGNVSRVIWWYDASGVKHQETRKLRGGDGAGGPYDWDNMLLDPDGSISDIECQAIGALTYDAGLSVCMTYSSGTSSSEFGLAADNLVGVFHYGNAIKFNNVGVNIPTTNLLKMVNPNLDAVCPVLLRVWGGGGHAVVCDGYGYNLTTLYHHLNMGWCGFDDAWYNLPNVDSTPSYNVVDQCIYNVFPGDSGEIISGRVVDYDGNPLSGAIVTATITGGGTYTTTTNDRGIYRFSKVPSDTEYTITASHVLFGSRTRVVRTGTSANNSVNTGNVWGVDFGPWKWAFKTGGMVYSSPAIDKDGNIYVGSADGKLYAIRPDGAQKWAFPTGGQVLSSPAIGPDGVIYVGSYDKNLYAIYPAGGQKWVFPTTGWVLASPVIASDGTVYVNSTNSHCFYAIYPHGVEKWKKTDLNPAYPAIAANGTIYCGAYDTGLHAYQPDGTKIWLLASDGLINSDLSIGTDGTVYGGAVHNGIGHLYAFQPDGRKKWAFPTQAANQKSSPAIGPDGTIYFGSNDKHLYAVKPDGTEKWAFPIQGGTESSPAVGHDGTVYVSSWDGRLYAVSFAGIKQWSCKIGMGSASSPVIGPGGTVYVGTYDGYLYAFDTSSKGLAQSSWPMYHHDARHTGNVGTPLPAVAFSSPAINLLLSD